MVASLCTLVVSGLLGLAVALGGSPATGSIGHTAACANDYIWGDLVPACAHSSGTEVAQSWAMPRTTQSLPLPHDLAGLRLHW